MATTRRSSSKKTDNFSNVLVQSLTLSAANTLTFEEVNLGLSLFDKIGLLISRVEYEPSGGVLGEMTTGGDEIQLAIVTSNQLSSLNSDQMPVVHMMRMKRFDAGTAATAVFHHVPFVHDFSQLPGGGLLVTPRPLYIAGDSDGLASAAVYYFRVYFTIMSLSAQDYFELLETRQYFG